jgi:queuine tRNA-ribosyltransferase
MVLDECVGYPATAIAAEQALTRTTRWAKKSLTPAKLSAKLTFGIVQGSTYPKLRQRSLAEITELDFNGFALGGLAVGEPETDMFAIIDEFAHRLPANRPRYIMGYGRPEQIVAAVKAGADMFDCVLPSRNARHGYLYTWNKNALTTKPPLNGKFYSVVRIQQAGYRADKQPIDPNCDCSTCQTYSRSYIRHLFAIGDPLGLRLATLHNVNFYLELMRRIRLLIELGHL